MTENGKNIDDNSIITKIKTKKFVLLFFILLIFTLLLLISTLILTIISEVLPQSVDQFPDINIRKLRLVSYLISTFSSLLSLTFYFLSKYDNIFLNKIKELGLILIFTLISAAVAILLSDIVIFPITYYSINNINIFNIVFKYVFSFFILSAFFLLLSFKVRSLYKDGNSTDAVIKYILIRPIQYLGFIFLSLILISGLIIVLYIIFSNNYYLIYRLSGGI